ncbi:DUF4190 domain-containing protein [Cryobacterium sp. BB307]|uniref:DUF4190 domain-containing protein n=1 Tax=Cryobacterium sp. BB307 TaxID=2716317 RepID=UPI001447E6CB|nr:DUF4190 domain-containing protein [Cryobacterium sp. BB307]
MTPTPPVSENPEQPTTPYAPAPQPAEPKSSNGLGIAALIVGIVAFVGSFIPFLNFVTGFVAFVGLVLGIIALFLKNKSKGVAIAGTAVSFVAMILSIVLATAYTAGFIAAVDNSLPKTEIVDNGQAPADEQSDDSADEVGTRENPAPIGTTIELANFGEAEFEVTLGAPILNANDAVKAANQFNDAPKDGFQYAVVPLTVTYVGDETGLPSLGVRVEFVSAAGTTHTQIDSWVVDPEPAFNGINELFPGGTASGNITILIPTADAESGTWAVSSLFGDKFFFAAQ